MYVCLKEQFDKWWLSYISEKYFHLYFNPFDYEASLFPQLNLKFTLKKKFWKIV